MVDKAVLKSWKQSSRRFGYRVVDFFPPENGPISGVEIGVYKGDHAALMLRRHPGLTLVGVDLWELWAQRGGDVYPDGVDREDDMDARMRSNMLEEAKAREVHDKAVNQLRSWINNGRCRLLMEEASEAALQFTDGELDFVYIDGDHSYGGCMRDLENWYPKVSPNGILAGHDYTARDVRPAVHDFADKHGLTVVPNGRGKNSNKPKPGTGWILI